MGHQAGRRIEGLLILCAPLSVIAAVIAATIGAAIGDFFGGVTDIGTRVGVIG